MLDLRFARSSVFFKGMLQPKGTRESVHTMQVEAVLHDML
jgi:hypothetical protein